LADGVDFLSAYPSFLILGTAGFSTQSTWLLNLVTRQRTPIPALLAVAVSPDGRWIAGNVYGDMGAMPRTVLIEVATGAVQDVPLPFGSLMWRPGTDEVWTSGDGSTFVMHVGAAHRAARRAGLAGVALR